MAHADVLPVLPPSLLASHGQCLCCELLFTDDRWMTGQLPLFVVKSLLQKQNLIKCKERTVSDFDFSYLTFYNICPESDKEGYQA